MLEIRNVTKIYRSKNGNSVKALDNISMTLPETGMVFILGKSGSGKSTLLNVIGGLDGYDSGEFIIKGKSSKDFAGSDFDAYRNTFIGFIFQEYNILDDFTVGANIGLALELQGKKATNEVISNILAQVEMLDYAKRRPNELSGGQKQRIAIARALVKDPEIIMADEPTGALDSNTGKQIFDTLKELSKRKLVIIVSHDRDFAEQYGDRIIEMKDGQILSDVTKHQVEARAVSAGILQMNDNLLRIEKGYQLTSRDLELINAYLREQPTDILISGDSRINAGVKNTAGISEDNSSSVFKETDEETDVRVKEYDKKNTKFIRSRLPMKNALKMGSSSLGHKKFRLVMTIFLSLIAFALFGFADTLGAYDKITAATDSIVDSNVQNASFSFAVKHTYQYADEKAHVSYYSAAMNDDDIKSIREQTGIDFIPVFNGTAGDRWGGSVIDIKGMMSSTDKIESGSAYTGQLYGFTSMSEENISSLGFPITGHLPEKEDEIVITKHMCDQFNATGFVNSFYNEKISAGDLKMSEGEKNSIIGKHFTLQMNGTVYNFVISGVVDTGFDTNRYANYIPSNDSNNNRPEENKDQSIMDMIMVKELENTLEYGFHALGYISQEKLDAMAENMRLNFGAFESVGTHMNNWNIVIKLPATEENGGGETTIEPKGEFAVIDKLPMDSMGMIGGADNELMNAYKVGKSSDLASLGKVTWFDGRTNNTLGANEILVPDSILDNLSNDFDVTDKVKTILTEMYGSEAVERLENGADIEGVIRDLEREKLMEAFVVTDANREELKKKRYEYEFGDLGDNPVPEGYDYSDEQLSEFFRERYYENNVDYLPEGTVVKSEWELANEKLKVFVEKFFNKQYDPAYGGDFYTRIINYAINRNGKGFCVTVDSFVNVAITEYAYKAVYGGNVDYNSDEFFNSILADNYGGKRPEDFTIEKDNAAVSYADYITHRTYEDVLEIFGEKRRSDFEPDAEAAFLAYSNFDISSLLEGAYVENRIWEENGEKVEKLTKYTIVGTFEDEYNNNRDLIISDTLYDDYMAYITEMGWGVETVAPHEAGIYAFVIAPMPLDKDVIRNLVEINYSEGGDYQFQLQNQVIDSLSSFNEFIEMGSKIFLYVGIGFAVFAALMLMNFISVSISYKRREIGILRAVGARSSDVFKIFFCEAFIIALINYILSLAATIAATVLLNNLVRNEGINVTLLHFGARQVILMFVISLAVAAIASFLPVWNIARRKPVDAIKNK